MEELMELLLEYQPPRSQWAPAANLLRLGAVTKLLQLLSLAANWDMYTGKYVSGVKVKLTGVTIGLGLGLR
jgi:hypothetical protein